MHVCSNNLENDQWFKNSFLGCIYWKNERMMSITKLSIRICLHNTLTFHFGQTGLVWFCGLSKPTEQERAPFLWCYLKGLLYLVGVQDFHIKRCISLLALIGSKRLLSLSPPKRPVYPRQVSVMNERWRWRSRLCSQWQTDKNKNRDLRSLFCPAA